MLSGKLLTRILQAEAQTQFFRRFRTALDQGLVLANTREQKKEELHLVLEVSDIIDELNSVTRLLMVQQDVIAQAKSVFVGYRKPVIILDHTLQNLKHYTREIETMTDDAKRTYESVSACTQ
jgi:hypothetical protein